MAPFLMGEASAIETALQTAFTTMKTDILSYVTTILPIALGIVGAIFAIRWAVKFFKSIASK